MPTAKWNPVNGNYDLDLRIKRERRLEARFGGMFSSRPINTGLVGLRYNFFGRSSSRADALAYFGKFYSAGQLKMRTDLSTHVPIFLEPVATLHRWDYFSSFTTLFDEVRPSYIILRELWGGLNTGMSVGNKGLARLDIKYGQNKDQYYQTADFSAKDTADVTEFYHFTSGLSLERNSLNRKQHPNTGEWFKAEVRYVTGEERTLPGTTYKSRASLEQRHEWLQAKVVLDKYFLPRGKFKFGFLLEGMYSAYPFFMNYTASVIRAPVFQPTPESKTYFLENFRASQYLAGGARAIIAVAKNKLDLRLEGYVFQPYKAILRNDIDQAQEGAVASNRAYLASGSLIYQSPIGPIWFNTSYIDGLDKPWAFSLNFGYVIFAQRSLE
jgi:NTE family protein